MLCSFFAGLALLLASIGLYGLMSYGVTRRTREIGVRVALGAQQRSVLWMILRETLGLALVGIAIGIPSALAVNKLISSMLFGLSSNDLPTIVMTRSEEHTSELQSRLHLVCRLLLEKNTPHEYDLY